MRIAIFLLFALPAASSRLFALVPQERTAMVRDLQQGRELQHQGDAAGAAQEIQAATAIASVYHPAKPVATNAGR